MTLVRPILDYCSSVWDPHTQTLINQLDAIQNRAARFVTGANHRKSSVSAMKQELNWEELTLRRKVNRLTTFHQAVAGHLAIPVQTLLRPVERNLRHTSPAANSFIPLSTNKNCFKYTFTPRTITDWNSLPDSLTSIEDKASFKAAVNSYLLQRLMITLPTHITSVAHQPVRFVLFRGVGQYWNKTRQDKTRQEDQKCSSIHQHWDILQYLGPEVYFFQIINT